MQAHPESVPFFAVYPEGWSAMNGTRDTIIRASHDDAAAAKAEARRTLDLLFDPDQVIVMRDDGRPASRASTTAAKTTTGIRCVRSSNPTARVLCPFQVQSPTPTKLAILGRRRSHLPPSTFRHSPPRRFLPGCGRWSSRRRRPLKRPSIWRRCWRSQRWQPHARRRSRY